MATPSSTAPATQAASTYPTRTPSPCNRHRSKFVVFTTTSSHYFAKILSDRLSCPLGNVIRKQFGDGEQYYRVDIQDRSALVGLDAIYVASTATDADLMELFRVGCELAALGTRRRIFVIPFCGYSTMERAVLPGEVVTAKTNARMLSAIPNSGLGNIFMLCDLHVSGLLQYFEGQCQRMEIYAESFLVEAIAANVDFSKGDVMFGSADLGRPLWVESFAKHFGTNLAFIRKTRRFEVTSVVGTPIGEVAGKRVIIYDDMTRSAHTLINAAEAYLAHGATDVMAVLSHFALNDESVVELLEKSCISKVISTNTHPMSQLPSVKRSKKFIIVDITPTFAETIRACGFFDNC